MSRVVLNSTANSGPSVGASSLVTDANSAFPGGPQLQRSASINTESYLRLPASPMSFSSNNISISGSSVVDGSSMMQQNSHQDQSSQHMQQRQPQQGASSATSQPTPQTGQGSVPTGSQARNLLTQEPNYLYQMQKKPRIDIKQDDLQKQVFQQLLQRQDSMQFQGHNPQLQALIQQQRLRHQQQQQQQQQQQMLQSIPPMQRAQLQQQQQLRNQLQQQNVQAVSATKRPYESGICAWRLMQYIYHQSHRPPDNSIAYWRKFVTEYFSPRAKKRWCLSMYANVGQHALGVFPQAAMDAWHCDICGSKSGRGFEATSEVLPRLNKIKFDSGVVDELLFLDMPREWRLPSGIMLLEYGKAVQESVYEQLRVVREGQLRIVFTNDLKILSWEFCARRHEELLPRRLVAPQVNQLVQVAQKYQNTISESGSNGISPQELQTNCNMFLTVGRQLAKNLELQSLNDLGFSKRYVRCLQISEVVNSMKDLIDISREHNVGPIETLKNYPRQTAAAKLQMQKMQDLEQLASAQGLPTDQNTLNKLMALNPNLGSNINNNHHMVGTGILNGSAQPSLGLSNYQNLLRQNSINSNPNSLRQEPQCSFNSNMDQSSQVQGPGPGSLIMGSLQNAPANGLSSSNLLQQQSLNGGNLLNQNHLQQQMIQQLMQEMMSNNGGMPQQQPQQNAKAVVKEEILSENNGTTIDGLTAGGMVMVGNSLGFRNNNSGTGALGNVPNRSNSFKAMSESNGFNQKAPDVLHSLHLPDIVQDMSYDFSDF